MIDLPEPKLIIFDCDGTVVDTETLHNQVFVDMLTEHGIPTTLDEVYPLVAAKTLAYGFETMRAYFGWHDFGEAEIEIYMQRFGDGILKYGTGMIVPGALETMIRCHHKTKIAVATNGEIGFTRMKLETLGLFRALPDVKFFTKDVVKNPKPAPDLFVHVAREFGVDPKDCWVIEDSVTGVTASVAACMTTLGFTGCAHDRPATEKALYAAGAAFVFGDYEDFPLAI